MLTPKAGALFDFFTKTELEYLFLCLSGSNYLLIPNTELHKSLLKNVSDALNYGKN